MTTGRSRPDTGLPRRDAPAHTGLRSLAERVRPTVLAGERLVPVGGTLGELLPGGGIPRGSVLSVRGGVGVTSTGLALAAAATAAGEWAVALDHDATLGGLAALEAGVVADRFAAVRHVPPGRWATVVAALLEGVAMVLATPPRSLRTGDARRLAARARERDAILVVLRAWPAEAALCLRVEGVEWRGPDDDGSGWLEATVPRVRVEGRGATGDLDHVTAAG